MLSFFLSLLLSPLPLLSLSSTPLHLFLPSIISSLSLLIQFSGFQCYGEVNLARLSHKLSVFFLTRVSALALGTYEWGEGEGNKRECGRGNDKREEESPLLPFVLLPFLSSISSFISCFCSSPPSTPVVTNHLQVYIFKSRHDP